MMQNVLLVQVENINVRMTLHQIPASEPGLPGFYQTQNSTRKYVERNFAYVTIWDRTAINCNKSYEHWVMQTKPVRSVSTMEYNLDMDFVIPLDYKKQNNNNNKNHKDKYEKSTEGKADCFPIESSSISLIAEKLSFLAFSACGTRSDGNRKAHIQSLPSRACRLYKRNSQLQI